MSLNFCNTIPNVVTIFGELVNLKRQMYSIVEDFFPKNESRKKRVADLSESNATGQRSFLSLIIFLSQIYEGGSLCLSIHFVARANKTGLGDYFFKILINISLKRKCPRNEVLVWKKKGLEC